ncbi:MAG: hypothetical protein DSY43_06630 [Gammaproteobacteria bacterium]|nr:MAG: hypothetical protein DSY43_06630 [Gammaproteobacteria bacterium]
MLNVSSDILKLQNALTGKTLAKDKLEKGMMDAFEGDLAHQCMGISAPARLKRTLELAKSFNLPAPTLKNIANQNF